VDDSTGRDDGDEEDTVEELDAQEAEERLEEVYQPLMRGQESDRRPGHSRSESYDSAIIGKGESIERKARTLEVALSYAIFFILGEWWFVACGDLDQLR
jgi:hypothetical protein